MRTTRRKPQLCLKCGKLLDASTSTEDNAVPKEDSISMCIGCGAIYIQHDELLVPPTKEELDSFPSEIKEKLLEMQISRSLYEIFHPLEKNRNKPN